MLNPIDEEPRLIMIPLSQNLLKFLETLDATKNNFLSRLAEDIIAKNKNKLLAEIDERLRTISKEEMMNDKITQYEFMTNVRDFVKNSHRYTLEELKNG